MGNPLIKVIKPGDRVTIRTPQGQERTGTAVMRSSHGGWVLNMGGKHGTPGVADERNIVGVKVRGGGSRGLGRSRSRSLGSSTAIHTQQATYASENIGYTVAQLTNKTRNGKCGAAAAIYGEMMKFVGEYEAHKRAGGRPSAPSHGALVHKATTEFTQTCLVNHNNGLARRRRRR